MGDNGLPRKKTRSNTASVKQDVKELKKDVDGRLITIKKQLDRVQKDAMKTITEQPLLALGVAFVAGMAVGIALSQSAD
jgi:ElaB/YqjD/DUF883 family membrane-anchored ribosome-binding protein